MRRILLFVNDKLLKGIINEKSLQHWLIWLGEFWASYKFFLLFRLKKIIPTATFFLFLSFSSVKIVSCYITGDEQKNVIWNLIFDWFFDRDELETSKLDKSIAGLQRILRNSRHWWKLNISCLVRSKEKLKLIFLLFSARMTHSVDVR